MEVERDVSDLSTIPSESWRTSAQKSPSSLPSLVTNLENPTNPIIAGCTSTGALLVSGMSGDPAILDITTAPPSLIMGGSTASGEVIVSGIMGPQIGGPTHHQGVLGRPGNQATGCEPLPEPDSLSGPFVYNGSAMSAMSSDVGVITPDTTEADEIDPVSSEFPPPPQFLENDISSTAPSCNEYVHHTPAEEPNGAKYDAMPPHQQLNGEMVNGLVSVGSEATTDLAAPTAGTASNVVGRKPYVHQMEDNLDEPGTEVTSELSSHSYESRSNVATSSPYHGAGNDIEHGRQGAIGEWVEETHSEIGTVSSPVDAEMAGNYSFPKYDVNSPASDAGCRIDEEDQGLVWPNPERSVACIKDTISSPIDELVMAQEISVVAHIKDTVSSPIDESDVVPDLGTTILVQNQPQFVSHHDSCLPSKTTLADNPNPSRSGIHDTGAARPAVQRDTDDTGAAKHDQQGNRSPDESSAHTSYDNPSTNMSNLTPAPKRDIRGMSSESIPMIDDTDSPHLGSGRQGTLLTVSAAGTAPKSSAENLADFSDETPKKKSAKITQRLRRLCNIL